MYSAYDNPRGRAAFTLIELLTVIAIMLVLAAIALPAIGSVRNATRNANTTSLIQGLQAACDVYAIEDRRHLPPPIEVDHSLRTAPTGQPARTLDLLRDRGMNWRLDMLGEEEATGRALLDGWKRTVQYQSDINMDKTPDRPAPRTDWNAKAREPYAYLWSFGKPSGNGDAADADPAWSEHWIYTRSSP